MNYEFSSDWPNQTNQAQKGTLLYSIDERISKLSKELEDFHNSKSYLISKEVKRIEKQILELQKRKQAEEVRMLVAMETARWNNHRIITHGREMAMLVPTTTYSN